MNKPLLNARQWCDDLQIRLMKAMDDAWSLAERTDDPAVRAKALAKARLCGQFAASARKIAALSPEPRIASPAQAPQQTPQASADPENAPAAQAVVARTALQRLKAGGGRRGRL